MRNLINMVKEETQWIEMQPASVDEMSISLRSGLQEWEKYHCQKHGGHPVRVRGLLLCPGVCGAREVLSVVAQLYGDEGQSTGIPPIRIGCVATCVDIRCALMDNGRYTLPGVLELIAEGWTNYLLHTGPTKSKQVAATRMGVQMEEVERLLRSVNPRLSQLSAPDGDTGQGHVLEALLDENAFNEPAMQRARLLSYPSRLAAQGNSHIYAFIPFGNPLFEELFNDLKPWPFHGNIYAIRGQISFMNENKKLFDVYHNTLTGMSRINSSSATTVETKSGENRRYWLTGTLAVAQNAENEGEESALNAFANWIRSTDIEEFIMEYLEAENNKIAARNARISRHPVPDVFNDPI
ncbi:unnamed protein product [Echinostoma caproni]|uniref:Retrotransposon hot spot (RHS) protein n=1 Tax=Echinostoma caproni TaxID=27848 RepID=A0A183A972_9TREM|nr:unnamed protein product [Echinostoma caproni]